MEGSVISFNPLIGFEPGAGLEYSNEANSPFFNSLFPTTGQGEIASGDFSYTPDADFRTGTLILNLPDLNGGFNEVAQLSNFVSRGNFVQSFTINFPSYGSFEAIVESGSIAAAPPQNNGGSGGFLFDADGNLVGGTVFIKSNVSTQYVGIYAGGPLTWSPLPNHEVGQLVTFTIADNGNFEMPGIDRRFGSGAYTLSVPFVATSNGILIYRGTDELSGGFIEVVFDVSDSGLLTVKWDDPIFSDYEQQTFE